MQQALRQVDNQHLAKVQSSTNSLTVSDQGFRRALELLQSNDKPTSHTALLPEHVCDEVIARCTSEKPNASPEQARQAAIMLLAGFPNSFTGDAAEKLPYMRVIERIFENYPAWAVNQIADPVKRKTGLFKFRPTDDELKTALDNLVAARVGYAVRAKWMKDEWERRRESAELDAMLAKTTPEQRAAQVKKLLGRFA